MRITIPDIKKKKAEGKKITMITSYDAPFTKIIDKSGTWFAYENQRLGQGRENAKDFLKEDIKLANKIETAIREKLASL